MRLKKFFVIFIAFLLITGLCFAQEKSKGKREKLQNKKADEIQGKSLIKKELLSRKIKKLNPPKRNIFSPSQQYGPENIPGNAEVKPKVEETLPEIEEDMFENLVEIAYIGYIVSGKKITALIVFEDETLAVEEGEMITPALKVIEVSSHYVEVIGSDEKKMKFVLEGEGK